MKTLQNVNAAAIAALYKRGRMVGQCAATPNAVAYSFAETGATRAVSNLGENWKAGDLKGRVANRGWLASDAAAGLVRK